MEALGSELDRQGLRISQPNLFTSGTRYKKRNDAAAAVANDVVDLMRTLFENSTDSTRDCSKCACQICTCTLFGNAK